jgi:predicted nucleic acid-binding Zn ribbon protein
MFIKLKNLLDRRISRLGNKEKVELGFVGENWPLIIDTLLEKRKEGQGLLVALKTSKPIKLENGVLTIETENQAIASELSLLGYELIDKLNQSLGRRTIRRLFFKLKRG